MTLHIVIKLSITKIWPAVVECKHADRQAHAHCAKDRIKVLSHIHSRPVEACRNPAH
jgi:hypothetical protein